MTKIEVCIKLAWDENADLSYLGEWIDKRSAHHGFVVRRETGELLDDGDVVAKWDHGEHVDRHSYPYFRPSNNHVPHNPEAWRRWVDPDVIAETEAKYGSLEQADYHYALEDWQRMENYAKEGWWVMGLVVDVLVDGVAVSNASLWGIESDSNPEYIRQVARDLLIEVQRSVPHWVVDEVNDEIGKAIDNIDVEKLDLAELNAKLKLVFEIEKDN